MPSSSVVSHPLLQLARSAVETYMYEHRMIYPSYPLREEFCEQRGAFVTLLLENELRGSIGAISPTQSNVALEVIMHAVAAATQDPRFTPVKPTELLDLVYVIDLVCDLQQITDSPPDHDPQMHGLAVVYAGDSGAVLPAIKGVETFDQQYELALRKAQLDRSCPYRMYQFSVERLTLG